MENNHTFFNNRGCKYFPCHNKPLIDNFNCLFCFCPLYSFGDKCGGNFKFTDKGIKVCTDCHLPHTPEYYNIIMSKLKEVTNKDSG